MVGKVTMRVGAGITGWVAENRRALVVPDTREEPRFHWVPGLDQERFVSMLSVPVLAGRQLVGVINVQMRTYMQPILENPFPAMEAAVAAMREETPVILVDAHGETTSEKIAIGRFLDGKASAVIGTHTVPRRAISVRSRPYFSSV